LRELLVADLLGDGRSVVALSANADTPESLFYVPSEQPYGIARIVPAVVSAAGAFGAIFRTDVSLMNATTNVDEGALIFRPRWEGPSPRDKTLRYRLEPMTGLVFRDVLAHVEESGAGSMDVIPDAGSSVPEVSSAIRNVGASGTRRPARERAVPPSSALSTGQRGTWLVPGPVSDLRIAVGLRTFGEGVRLQVWLVRGHVASFVGYRSVPPSRAAQYSLGELLEDLPFRDGDRVVVALAAGRAVLYWTVADTRTSSPSYSLVTRETGSQVTTLTPEGARDGT